MRIYLFKGDGSVHEVETPGETAPARYTWLEGDWRPKPRYTVQVDAPRVLLVDPPQIVDCYVSAVFWMNCGLTAARPWELIAAIKAGHALAVEPGKMEDPGNTEIRMAEETQKRNQET